MRARPLVGGVAAATALLIAGGSASATGNAVGASGAGDPYYPMDGNGGYDVSHYDVGIDYTPSTTMLIGDTTVTATTTQQLEQFDLDFYGFQVDSITVNGKPATWTRSDQHELVVTPSSRIAKKSELKVRVKYHGQPKPTSGLDDYSGWNYSSTGGAFAANEPHSAASWYPVNDTTRDKATFTLNATVPNGYSVISNGEQTGTSTEGAKTTYTWTEKDPIIGYLTTVAIDKFTYLKQQTKDGIPLVSAFAPGAEDKMADEKRLPEVIELLEHYFGPYPQSSGGGIFVADQIGFSLETQDRPTYAAWADLPTIVHENGHQWWGDSMSVKTWRDVCMNECFASYGEWLWEQDKNNIDLNNEYSSEMADFADNDRFWANPLWDMGAGREFTNSYTRGPLFLQALRAYIGDKPFFEVLRTYSQLHRGGNTSMQDFEKYVQRHATRDVHGFFQAWVYGTTRPADKYIWFGPFRKPSAAKATTPKLLAKSVHDR
ncbi:MAG TPA: M1 family metallopeptidase [Flexivirga sp.]|uniref:M1 family metallopeptidase n=1 Tax=Flexivirga sp. TaxID=1962927 RepID=UPI002B9FA547|nr:M1 family metallopeptidase [Flexivirga sp.]HWC22497.1 M1 family metallopeptidase [Flexivirga sp.]